MLTKLLNWVVLLLETVAVIMSIWNFVNAETMVELIKWSVVGLIAFGIAISTVEKLK